MGLYESDIGPTSRRKNLRRSSSFSNCNPLARKKLGHFFKGLVKTVFLEELKCGPPRLGAPRIEARSPSHGAPALVQDHRGFAYGETGISLISPSFTLGCSYEWDGCEAAKSLSGCQPLPGDLSSDHVVSDVDLTILQSHWLNRSALDYNDVKG